MPCTPYSDEAPGPNGDIITQDWMWRNFSKFLRPDDLVIIETGTSQLGFTATPLPSRLTTWTQEIFGSIGYATGAAVGASIAHAERGGTRTILVTGDGSLQLTVQGLADLLRHGTNPFVFVINNDGYTVERIIHGPKQPYNDIPMWKYTAAFDFFGPTVKSESYVCRTPKELDALLDDPKFGEPSCPKVFLLSQRVRRGWLTRTIQLVEIVMDRLDAPETLKNVCAAVDKFNAQ
jgi:pyruvate decarboxylase